MPPDHPARHPSGRRDADRLFLAVALTEEARRGLEAHLREALGGHALPGRPVAAASWHLTLRFLGGTPGTVRARLVDELRTADLGSRFTLDFDRLGAFPRPARATVLWLGVAEGERELRALAAEVEEAVRRAGLPPEPRDFSPHLTLSRIRPAQDVRSLLERTPPFRERMPVDAVVLFRSHLGAGGARYEALEHFPLRP
ncbi:MAG TPA: RNA 2',3'-cyclic phosphodiesterase [Longimicrobiaceae bacterium]|nr:RNA 2',3'-cyclic phosphodiesterase [Longimicrobiaceae bacterium]